MKTTIFGLACSAILVVTVVIVAGISRATAAFLLGSAFNSKLKVETYSDKGESRERYNIKDKHGKSWYLVEDRSIEPINRETGLSPYGYNFSNELVTPVIEDLDDLSTVLELFKLAGACVNDSCGCHIHVDAPEDVSRLKNIISSFICRQSSIVELWSVPKKRVEKYCKVYPFSFANSFALQDFRSVEEVKDFFYCHLSNGECRNAHNNSARYYALNIDSIHKRNTLEYRFFNSTLDIKMVKSYLDYLNLIMEVC